MHVCPRHWLLAGVPLFSISYSTTRYGEKRVIPMWRIRENNCCLSCFIIFSTAVRLTIPKGDCHPDSVPHHVWELVQSKSRYPLAIFQTFQGFLANNTWTDVIGKPTVLNRILAIITPKARTISFQAIHALGNPLYQNEVDIFSEKMVLGCFYTPKNNTFMIDLGLGLYGYSWSRWIGGQ